MYTNKGINVLSLFDGIGGARLALQRAGIKVLGNSFTVGVIAEILKFADFS